jgi:hypothetical protein
LQINHFKASVAIAIPLLLIATAPFPIWAQQTDAATAISSAKNTISTCYTEAEQAEAAGANITVLVGILNDAGVLLSRAEFAYATNDFDTALNLAVRTQNTLKNFVGEANTLQQTATQEQNQGLLINVVGSIVGTFVIIVADYAAWLFLKKKYETTKGNFIESPKV